jgi:hypothetical protein
VRRLDRSGDRGGLGFVVVTSEETHGRDPAAAAFRRPCRSPYDASEMASWRQFEEEAPELAERARALLDAHKHKTLATLRRDGSPRISGTEAEVVDGEVLWGSMPNSLKALDLRRDPRFALHSGSDDPPEWSGDAKLSGRAEELDDDDRKRALVRAQGHAGEGDEDGGPGEFHLFRADLDDVVVTRLDDDRTKLVIELWRPGRGVKTVER